MVVPRVRCCFWPNTAKYLGPCEPEHYRDEEYNTCFFTFLAFLFALLRAGVAVSLLMQEVLFISVLTTG